MKRTRACLVVQGGKHVVIDEQVLDYDAGHCFVTFIEVPATGRIVEASAERPYLAITFVFEPLAVAETPHGLPSVEEDKLQAGFAVGPISPNLIEAWTRMLRLLDHPGDIPVLAPLVAREILYRLLQGSQASLLRQVARSDSHMAQIRRALAWITTNFEQPLSVEKLADLAAMRHATFHRHFKVATAMSPLQYQKMIRLQQARRMLVIEKHEPTQVAYAVGYESPSQFSREYARQFGAPPARDAERLRSEPVVLSDAWR
jgi:AraC-like DNA-binding protein